MLVGVPHVAALQRVLGKLKAAQIRHYCWHEPDYNFGFTAIAAMPDRDEQRRVLGNYRLWKYHGAGEEQSSGSLAADRPTNYPVAQLQSDTL